VFDNKNIDIAFHLIVNDVGVDGFAGCDGRVRLIIMLTRTRTLKSILIQKFVGVSKTKQ
jgi:hypothetical protein